MLLDSGVKVCGRAELGRLFLLVVSSDRLRFFSCLEAFATDKLFEEGLCGTGLERRDHMPVDN